jgi:hypothetical protein
MIGTAAENDNKKLMNLVFRPRNVREKIRQIRKNNRVPTAVSEEWDGIEMREIRVQIRAQDAFFGVRHGR